MNKIPFILNGAPYDLLNKEVMSFSFLDASNKYNIQHAPTNIGLDLLTIGLIVSYCDRHVKREDFPNAWNRDISVTIPVLEIDKWESIKTSLVRCLSFLSGDYWDICFTKREKTDNENRFYKFNKNQKKSAPSTIENRKMRMLSGGLDSFIGAIDLLEKTKEVIFVNIHGRGNGFVNDFNNVKNALSEEYDLESKDLMFKTFYVGPGKTIENTTRARSFTFFTTALALMTCFDDINELVIPENGTISLNVPLTIGRFGSSSTRTTHPFYINELKNICAGLGINISIINPYQFKTKGEMIADCCRPDFLKKHLTDTMSCSHPNSDRYQGDAHPKHCGTCLPCFIRMAAEYKAYGELITHFDRKPSETTKSTERCLRIRLSQVESIDYDIEVQKNGPLNNNLHSYSDLYKRSLNELSNLISYLDSLKE